MSNDVQIANLKVSGYLEKKSKLKIKSWKKYWYVLEGRLLLYYRSKEEYDSISPCKGSINLGPPCNIKPMSSISNAFQIDTRANTIILRGADRFQQEKWMQAILTVLKQNMISTDKKQIDFRYSNDDLVQESHKHQNHEQQQRQSLNEAKIKRIRSIGGQSYGGSLGTINKMSEIINKPKLPQSQSLIKLLQNKNREHENSGDEPYSKINRNTKLSKSNSDKQIDSILVENDQYVTYNNNSIQLRKGLSYSENIYERISQDSILTPDEGVTTENDQYNICVGNVVKEPEYAIPLKKTDQNKNSVLLENDLYDTTFTISNTKEYYYAEPAPVIDDDYNISEALYEEPDQCVNVTYTKSVQKSPVLKKKHGFAKSLRSSASRMSKMWRRKNKKKNKLKPEAEEEIQSESSSCVSNVDMVNNIEVLNELQKILESKKHVIEEKVKNAQEESEHIAANEKEIDPEVTLLSEESKDLDPLPSEINEACPELPPHIITNKSPSPSSSSIYDTPTNNRPILTFLPKKKNRKSFIEDDKTIKTIDEILAELDKEAEEYKVQPSVKKLIEIFDVKANETKVVLRNKKPQRSNQNFDYDETRNSDNLNQLLEDLAKITNAPILTPGITNSLNVPHTSSQEWFDLIPISSNRRNSDPDYDIPRSHKPYHSLKETSDLLINNYVRSNEEIDKLLDVKDYDSHSDNYSSDSDYFFKRKLDPDSLEMNRDSDEIEAEIQYKTKIDENSESVKEFKWTDQFNNNDVHHVYENDFTCYKRDNTNYPCMNDVILFKNDNTNKEDDEVIYAKPRLLISTVHAKDDVNQNSNVKSMDVFIDSLETSGESSTIF